MDGSMALIVIDVQNDFCPGGALPVPGGDQVVPPLNRVVAGFSACNLPVLASRDWHPEETGHFQQQGGLGRRTVCKEAEHCDEWHGRTCLAA